MMNELAAGFGSLNAAMELLKTLNSANTQAKLNEVKLSLQQSILEGQSALSAARENQLAASDRIRQLEQQIMQFEHWEAEAERYELKAIYNGAFAYMHKEGMDNGEPPHWLCATCFENRKKSILQTRGQMYSKEQGRSQYANWACNTCRGEVLVAYTRKPSEPWPKPPETAES